MMLTDAERNDAERIRLGVHGWLEARTEGQEEGRFSFCSEGSRVPVTGHAALFTTCFAMKIAWQTGAWAGWAESRRNAAITFVRSFQEPDGVFRDPWLAANSRPGPVRLLKAMLHRGGLRGELERQPRNERAETRQAASTLRMVGESFAHRLPLPVRGAEEVRTYAEGLGWENPWAAGSHLSHLAALATMNREAFGAREEDTAIERAVLAVLEDYRDQRTGTWGKGNVPDDLRVNGAMKVLTALEWMQPVGMDHSTLLRFALGRPFCADGCGFLNRLYVVQQAWKRVPEAARDETREQVGALARAALESALRFANADGGFSFYKGRAQHEYYGARISAGRPVGELHGTMLMTWAVAIALDLLGGAEGWRCPRP